ncbi:MAG TPA: DUF5916 domain-containing protein [Longimicrobiales bacterium]|nr:DUF5916 domain-containing protein [Longimicrobiales bacterium]
MRLRPLIFIASVFLPHALAAQSPAPPPATATASATKVARAPKLDGHLDDEAWTNAQWITQFVQREPKEGDAASQPMKVAFAYDNDALYIGARMEVSDPAVMRALVTRRDREETSDQLLVSFDTYHDQRTAYTFAVSSAGVRIDYYHSSDFETNRDYTYDPVWQAETTRDANGWTVEIRIPFTQLRFNAAAQQIWGVNIVRNTPASNERVFWRLIGRNETGWSSRMGQLIGIGDIGSGRRIEMLPYVATDTKRNGVVTAANPFSKSSETNARAGGDVKMGLGPSLTLDATFNPDFGQVEADPAEVNLSAYETFFAERRPFFLEGTQLLAARGNFYSRRIGAPPVSSLPGVNYVEPISNATILGAAKLTGRPRNRLSIAALVAATAEEKAQTFITAQNVRGEATVAPFTGYGIVAAQREFGNAATTSSVLYSNLTGVQRDLPKSSYLSTIFNDRAYTGIVDYRIRWKGGKYDMSAFIGWSYIHGDTLALISQQRSSRRFFQRPDQDYMHVDTKRTSMFGTYTGINHSKLSGKHWLWDIDYYAEAPGYELNDVGRIGSADDRGVSMDVVYRETKPGKLFRNYQTGLYHGTEWDFGGYRQYTQLQSFNNVQFKNYWQAFANVTYGAPSQADNLTRGGPLMGVKHFWQFDAGTNNRPGSKTRLRASTTLNKDGAGGWYASVTAGTSWRMGTQWEVSIDPRFRRNANARQFITSTSNGPAETFNRRYVFSTVDQSELAARIRVNYAITPDLTLETYAEPFASSARFYEFGELPFARAYDLRYYTPQEKSALGLPNLDFNVRSFRSNVVMRWEWRPGSTLFLVWQQNRSANEAVGDHVTPHSVWDALSDRGTNFFAVKLNYWIPIK